MILTTSIAKTKNISLYKNGKTKPGAPLLYPNINIFSEQYINDQILANNEFNNNDNVIKDTRNFTETQTNNYNKKLRRYKFCINIAEITEILLS